MAIQTEVLAKLQEDQIFVEIHQDAFEESDSGYIVDYNDEFIAFEAFDEDRSSTGLSVVLRKNANRFGLEDGELVKASDVVKVTQKILNFPKLNFESLRALVNQFQEEFGYVTVHIQTETREDFYVGEVLETSETKVLLNQYGNKLLQARQNVLIEFKDITKIEGGGVYEEQLKQLYS